MKKKLKELVDSHNDWVRSLGVDIDSEYHSFDGYDMPDYTCRPSLPTSDKIAGVGLKRKYENLDDDDYFSLNDYNG